MPNKKLYIIAGEESGDNIGSKMIKAIYKKASDTEIKGVGGTKMVKQGLVSSFPMQEISLMGFIEIIPHIPNLLKRINQTVDEILDFNPDSVVTIDSPGFNYRVAKKLKKKGFKGKLIHYVAPTVWAYKESRALKTAKIFDKLLCILPWELPYFEKHGLDTKFVGHPIFEDIQLLKAKEKQDVRKNYLIKKDDIVITCLIGSRAGEVERFAEIYAEALRLIEKKHENIKVFILSTDSMKPFIQKFLQDFPKNTAIITEQGEKHKLLQISNAAIVKSGTVGLEVASYKCPHAICYKVSWLSYKMIKAMVKIDLVNLVNISANSKIIPELIQDDMTAANISKTICGLLENPDLAKLQVERSQTELKKMGLGKKQKPSEIAASEVF